MEEQENLNKPYLKYSEKFKKINLLSIIMHALTIVMILAFLFIPMFSYERVITEADFDGDINKFFQYMQTLSPEELLSGKEPTIKEGFSIFDELIKNFSAFSSDGEIDSMLGLLFMLFPLFTVITLWVLSIRFIPPTVWLRQYSAPTLISVPLKARQGKLPMQLLQSSFLSRADVCFRVLKEQRL